MMANATDIAFAPMLPWWLLGAAAAAALAAAGLAFARGASGATLRLLLSALLVAALARPTLVSELREPERDVAVVAVDRSDSQRTGVRTRMTDEALDALESRFDFLPRVDLLVVETAGGGTGEPNRGTALLGALREAWAAVPRRQRAGAFVITDGLVHDATASPSGPGEMGPVHVLLTGDPERDGDRRLSVTAAPAYGIVGKDVEIELVVEDLGPEGAGRGGALVSVSADGRPLKAVGVSLGRAERIALPVEHAGNTIFEFGVEEGPRELSLTNNRAVVTVNGVRDRLKVLLVSGRPHAGERVWRNLLKSDPAVDLIHFTILRPPYKQDATPIRELALISFPVRELFEERLEEFDLVVFDRYARRGVIPQLYLANVADYVRGGGALLDAAGPAFASKVTTLHESALSDVYPGAPTGSILTGPFRPVPTEVGRRHPVTGPLVAGSAEPRWGRWLRQIDVERERGHTLMSGAEGRPLLLVDRVGEGRVGQLASDQVWLWARGFQGGGPHAELLRRLAHWLMKEPDLEEDALTARMAGGRLEVERRKAEADPEPVTALAPDGRTLDVELRPTGAGRWRGAVEADTVGVWQVRAGEKTAIAGVAVDNPLEFEDLRPTATRLAPVAEATGGRLLWLGTDAVPDLRQVRPGGRMSGRGWLGLRDNRAYRVIGIERTPLLPGWLVLALAALLLAWLWRREGQRG
ncbi:MAG: hypothetical protein F4Y03_13205 [Alphaproteobacteria bacterium]|nr:hypothetical protein [Alphaproteobacteria bacterium]